MHAPTQAHACNRAHARDMQENIPTQKNVLRPERGDFSNRSQKALLFFYNN